MHFHYGRCKRNSHRCLQLLHKNKSKNKCNHECVCVCVYVREIERDRDKDRVFLCVHLNVWFLGHISECVHKFLSLSAYLCMCLPVCAKLRSIFLPRSVNSCFFTKTITISTHVYAHTYTSIHTRTQGNTHKTTLSLSSYLSLSLYIYIYIYMCVCVCVFGNFALESLVANNHISLDAPYSNLESHQN